MSAAERVAGIVELLEMILLALPLRDMLLARGVSKTAQALIDDSAALEDIHQNPVVTAKLDLPFECSISSPENPILKDALELHYDRPVTVRQRPSPIGGASSMTYRYVQNGPVPETFPRYSLGAKFRPRALRLSHENDSKYITLLPGTPLVLHFDFGRSKMPPGYEQFAPNNAGLNYLEVGRTYVLGVTPGRSLPAFVGTKRSLLEKRDNGESLKPYRFHKMYGEHIIEHGGVGKALPVVGVGTILFKVVE